MTLLAEVLASMLSFVLFWHARKQLFVFIFVVIVQYCNVVLTAALKLKSYTYIAPCRSGCKIFVLNVFFKIFKFNRWSCCTSEEIIKNARKETYCMPCGSYACKIFAWNFTFYFWIQSMKLWHFWTYTSVSCNNNV